MALTTQSARLSSWRSSPARWPTASSLRWRISQAVGGVVNGLGRVVCGLRRNGHNELYDFSEPHRMRLRCMDCGKTGPGWSV
jgi:hypothetical protein